MINIIQDRSLYKVIFKYDPQVIQLIKEVPGRQWSPDNKYWTIPADKLGFLLKKFEGTVYESQISVISNEHLNENQSLDSTTQIPNVDLKNVKMYIKDGYNFYNHQLDFMKYAIHNNGKGLILADEQGLGKTLEVINLALTRRLSHNYKHVLIICCVASSVYNWEREVNDNTNGQEVGYILGSRLRKKGPNKGKVRYDSSTTAKLQDLQTGHMYGDVNAPELPYFLIMNIEALQGAQGRTYVIAKEIIQWADDNRLHLIAIDEVHKNCSPHSKQGKLITKIKNTTGNAIEWIPMTGTPITKQPTDVYLPLKLIDGHHFKNYGQWCWYFCIYGGYGDHEIIGYKNIDELKSMLQDRMIRRRKDEVLDLPAKIRTTYYVENTELQHKLYTQVQLDILSHKDQIMATLNPLSKFLRLRQVNGSPEIVDPTIQIDNNYIRKNAKLQAVMDQLEDIHSRGEKVVIFSNWVQPLRTLYKYIYKKYNVCCFTGTMKEEDRQYHKKVFIENPKYTVMLGTIGALGTTHTLTVANNIIFYDEPWNPSDKEQAEDRCHRIGTTKPLNISTIITMDTIDEKVHNILSDKSTIANYIVDNELDIRNNPRLFDYLMG